MNAMKKRLGKEIRQYALMMIGLLACGLAYRLFLIPNEVAPGGFTGVGQLLKMCIRDRSTTARALHPQR